MPGLSGFETLAQVRSLAGGASLPTIIVSGNKDQESIEQAEELGAVAYLLKPVDPNMLSQITSKYL